MSNERSENWNDPPLSVRWGRYDQPHVHPFRLKSNGGPLVLAHTPRIWAGGVCQFSIAYIVSCIVEWLDPHFYPGEDA